MNTTNFRIHMVKNQESQTILANDMGIAQSALSNRINGKIEWRESEINFFRKRWKLSDQETVDIFFAEQVSEKIQARKEPDHADASEPVQRHRGTGSGRRNGRIQDRWSM